MEVHSIKFIINYTNWETLTIGDLLDGQVKTREGWMKVTPSEKLLGEIAQGILDQFPQAVNIAAAVRQNIKFKGMDNWELHEDGPVYYGDDVLRENDAIEVVHSPRPSRLTQMITRAQQWSQYTATK